MPEEYTKTLIRLTPEQYEACDGCPMTPKLQ